MRAGEMSTAERIVRKIRREPFIDEENDFIPKKNVIERERAVVDLIAAFYLLLISADHFLYIHMYNVCTINAKHSFYFYFKVERNDISLFLSNSAYNNSEILCVKSLIHVIMVLWYHDKPYISCHNASNLRAQFLIVHFAMLNAFHTPEFNNAELLQARATTSDRSRGFSTEFLARDRDNENDGEIERENNRGRKWATCTNLLSFLTPGTDRGAYVAGFYLEFIVYSINVKRYSALTLESPNIFIPKKLYFSFF